MKIINNPSWFNKDAGILLVRIALATVFIFAGVAKLMVINDIIGFFAVIGIPAWLTWIVAIVETLGGVAMLLGIYTRFFGVGLAIIMATAYFTVHMQQGFAASQPVIVLFLIALAVVATGPGKYALKKKVQSAPIL
ncbi:MAG: hypothetical protein RLY66_221 [Candidatus Parcubacteria bacterium]|jgi:uncharacterized membrane protein YphA (DoxX/SURF4 family)